MKMLSWYSFLLLTLLCMSCGNRQKAKEPNSVVYGSYHNNVLGMVNLHTYDHYARRLKQGHGFYISPSVIVAPLDLVQGAYRVKLAPLGTTQLFDITGYTSFDLKRNLVTLHTQRKNSSHIPLGIGHPEGDTLYTLFRESNQLMIRKSASLSTSQSDSSSYLSLASVLEMGKPAFYKNHSLAGIILSVNSKNGNQVVLKGAVIDSLSKTQLTYPEPIINLSRKSDKIYTSHQLIEGFKILTDMGDVVIKLYDDTPEYRDNFIKLVEDQFYDSLLVHRVLKGFLIQTGAADTRYATPEDVVGWQGPGYTLPMKLVSGKFHRRGTIAASKLPDARNPKNTSDGSQFYIVSGRVFTNQELDELAEQKNRPFSGKQRQVYTTVGGAPHLDGDYTVFGEVTRGMSVVDKISFVETDQADRPLKDIRIIRVEIIKK